MTNFNFFNYCSSLFGSWNKDLTYDCRFTVGSPSGRYCSSLLKLITVLVLVLTLGVGNVWGEDQTWNLTTNSYSSISDNEVVWSSSYVTANAVKGSGTKVNNYCPTSYSQHRLYNGNTLTITPASGYTISSIKITATGASYRIAGTWTNGTASSPSGQTYTTITPTDGTSAVSCAINATCRLTEIKVTYSAASTLSVSGNATSLAMGDAKVNGSGVTNSTLTFSGANLTANATLSITGTNASMFSVEPTSVTPTSKTITDQTISVTYNPTSAGNHTATLTIASSGATSKTITLTGTGKYEVVWKCAGYADVTTLVASGSRPTFPSTPSSCDTGEGASTTFYGWATGTWSGKATNLEDSKLSGITIYTSAASMPTVSANGTTYHAVFAKETSNYSNTTVKETFESQTASTTYNSTQIYGQSSSNAGIGWKMYYGTVSTTGALKGSKSAQMRWYKNSSSNYPYIQDTTQLLSLSKVKFKAKVGKTAVKMDVSYSTNKGDSWTKVGDAVTFANTDTITLSYDIPGADATKYLIKIGVSSSSTTPTSDYSSFQVDEVSFTYKTGSTTYSNFMTTCCTALGSINGSVSWNHFGVHLGHWGQIPKNLVIYIMSMFTRRSFSARRTMVFDADE